MNAIVLVGIWIKQSQGTSKQQQNKVRKGSIINPIGQYAIEKGHVESMLSTFYQIGPLTILPSHWAYFTVEDILSISWAVNLSDPLRT